MVQPVVRIYRFGSIGVIQFVDAVSLPIYESYCTGSLLKRNMNIVDQIIRENQDLFDRRYTRKLHVYYATTNDDELILSPADFYHKILYGSFYASCDNTMIIHDNRYELYGDYSVENEYQLFNARYESLIPKRKVIIDRSSYRLFNGSDGYHYLFGNNCSAKPLMYKKLPNDKTYTITMSTIKYGDYYYEEVLSRYGGK